MNRKMRKMLFCFCLIHLTGLSGILSAQVKKDVEIKNNSASDIHNYIAKVPLEKLDLKLGEYITVNQVNQKEESPVELVSDIQGNYYAIFCVSTIDKDQVLKYRIQKGSLPAYPKRTYAEISHKIGGEFQLKKTDKYTRNEYVGGYSWVKSNYLSLPGSFTDHSYYIKCEGPVWESDQAAFRFYLDNRNAIDAFGKTTTQIVLPTVGACDFDAYHKLDIWGMDNSKVGKTLGLGSIATWNGSKATRIEKRDSTICYVATDGKLQSQVKTIYYGWENNNKKSTLTSLISIDAGSKASHMEIITDNPVDNIATGILKDANGKLMIQNKPENDWGCIATFGEQSINKDIQGLVVFFRTKHLKEITEDELNHVVVLQPDKNNYTEYYFMSTWELAHDAIKTEKEFESCIDDILVRLNGNVTVVCK